MELKKLKQFLRDERGAVLAIALLIMIALALIGAAAMITSTMELDIARNERLAKESFYMADGGTSLAPIIIEEAIETRALPVIGGITINADLMSELLGATETDSPEPDKNPDLRMQINNKDITVDIDRIATQVLAGGAAEFAGGYEGIGGGGASGGIAIFYRVDSYGGKITRKNDGTEVYLNKSAVETYYRKVVNIAGE
jgi:Tfp pilus assembly protein PilX